MGAVEGDGAPHTECTQKELTALCSSVVDQNLGGVGGGGALRKHLFIIYNKRIMNYKLMKKNNTTTGGVQSAKEMGARMLLRVIMVRHNAMIML